MARALSDVGTFRSARILLPSGRTARVARRDRPARASRPGDVEILRGTLEAIEDGRLEVHEGARPLDVEAVLDLHLADVHVLRDAAIRLGLVPSETEAFPCENCGAPLRFEPGTLDLQDLSERYAAEAPVPIERTFPLRDAVPVPRGGRATRVRLRTVTAREALPFLRAVSGDGFAVTPSFLRGMGVVALESEDGRARIEKPALLGRALARAPDAVWIDVESAYLRHVYPRAAVAPLVCEGCGVLTEMEVPWPRELDPADEPAERRGGAPFLSPEAFEDRVEAIGGEVFRAMGVQNLALRVEPGPADTDLGGEPLLGSYEPRREIDEAGYTRLEFLVTVYFRTFERQWAVEGEYDVDAEIRETIEHEVEHHLHHLAGHDPLDAEERAEAEAEVARVAGGRRRVRSLALRGLLGDVWTFARTVGPWALGGVVALGILAWLLNSF